MLRVLELKNKLGLFENPYKDADERAEQELLLCAEHRKAARKAAEETFVLLENQGMLPLSKKEKVAFIGPFTEEKAIIGAWSIFAEEKDAVSVREGVENYGGNVLFAKGCETLEPKSHLQGMNARYENTKTPEETEQMIKQAVKAASKAKKVVLCLGEHMAMTGEAASRGDIRLPKTQRKLLKSVARVNENVTVVLFTGRPLDIREVKRYAKAILVVWMPGTEGGNAIARVLYGKTSPSGKLPMSFPYCAGQVPVFYGEFRTGRYRQGADPENRFVSRYLDIPSDPLYPFGYGLSYSSFTCSKVTLSGNRLCRDGSLEASVILKNTGTVKAKEVVQMYLSDLAGSVVRRFRTEHLITVCVVAYIGIALFACVLRTQTQFWILAIFVGMFQGGIQALSRSYYAKIIPPEQSGEYFGLLDICGKGASFIGTAIVSVVSQLTGDINKGVAMIVVLFVVGVVLFRIAVTCVQKNKIES